MKTKNESDVKKQRKDGKEIFECTSGIYENGLCHFMYLLIHSVYTHISRARECREQVGGKPRDRTRDIRSCGDVASGW